MDAYIGSLRSEEVTYDNQAPNVDLVVNATPFIDRLSSRSQRFVECLMTFQSKGLSIIAPTDS